MTAPTTGGSTSPGGTWYGAFVRYTTGNTNTFHAPTFGGLDADLVDNANGTYTMTFHSSQEQYTFDSLGCSSCNALITKDVDRNGNEIDYGYNTTKRQLTSITDTHGRAIAVVYGSNGHIATMTETDSHISSPRTWTYHYNSSNQLDYYLDPTGARTDYSYDSAGDLATITDPARPDGVRPLTTITNTNGQVTQIDYSTNATGSADRWTYDYNTTDEPAEQTACQSSSITWAEATTVTDVSDPQHSKAVYCYQDRAGNPSPTTPNGADANAQSIRVVDGLNHYRSSTYNPDMGALQATGQGNDGVANGSTVFAYNTNNTLKSGTDPTDKGGETAGATSFDYPTSSSTPGGTFLPSSTATSGSTCSSMTYDATGNLTDVYAGQTASGATLCSSGTAGKHSHVDYNTDGTVKDAYGPVAAALATRTAADETTYTYYTGEPNAGEVSQVVKPGGNTTCTTDRTGCTSYVYDARSRVTSTTDGNGNKTSYSYDNDDRITQVLTGGASTCTPTAGTCIQYAYDGEGNLTSRIDANGTTTFTFDWLNNPATQTQPEGTVLATAYDAAGNLTQYQQTLPGQSADTVNYGYDAANELHQRDRYDRDLLVHLRQPWPAGDRDASLQHRRQLRVQVHPEQRHVPRPDGHRRQQHPVLPELVYRLPQERGEPGAEADGHPQRDDHHLQLRLQQRRTPAVRHSFANDCGADIQLHLRPRRQHPLGEGQLGDDLLRVQRERPALLVWHYRQHRQRDGAVLRGHPVRRQHLHLR